ncbi:hypothetical protein [Oceaniglobus roseus]|uniref:hypothetical protein n=1 Tax=Oceaniglobus roseus TaxID=1737570 RepID=UPI000C7EC11B|nr:hypothetical protein [Kandeliimicrobium roseum]
MKLTKLALIGGTALTLSMSAAVADGSGAWLDQNGSSNTALIEQSGDSNFAGSSTAARNLKQNGDNNDLNILQSGNNNRIGNDSRGGDLGLDQNGNLNSASITQSSSYSYVNQIQQNASSTGTAVSNTLTVIQSDPSPTNAKGNVISNVSQTNDGAGTDAAQQNTVSITQNRSINQGNGGFGSNVIAEQGVGGNTSDRGGRIAGGVIQSGTANSATIQLEGGNNILREVNQDGSGNTPFARQDGVSNGQSAWTGAAAAAGGLAEDRIFQIGNDNSVQVTAEGDSNQFGFTQSGNSNSATSITLLGNSNQLGVNQAGDDNTLSLGTVTGSFNNVGVEQVGDTNLATLSITGDSNGAGLGFTGYAAMAAGSLSSGLISQQGDLNTASLTVAGDLNAFLLASIGDGNTITGTVSGNMNQAAVVQMGGANTASFTQTGNGNNAGISQ